ALKIYLQDEIMALEDLGVKGGDNGGSILYFKMDSYTLELVNKLFEQARQPNPELQAMENKKEIKNLVIDKDSFVVESRMYTSKDLDTRDKNISKQYSRGINLVKEFCESNSLKVTYAEPIEDRISRMKDNNNQSEVLMMLQNDGAETVNYYTDEDLLNVDLSITITEINNENNELASRLSKIEYKASESKIEGNFDFQTSKLNEFRILLLGSNEDIDYKSLNEFINKCMVGEITSNMRFVNRVNENFVEYIRVEKGNVYYRLVYDTL
ncbi:MAG: hypothetical protein ACRCSD_11150, partial [Clostridium sp.]